MSWYLIIIALALLITGGIFQAKAPSYSEINKKKWPWDWRDFTGQIISIAGVMTLGHELRVAFALPPFTQKPLVTGLFYFAVIGLAVLFEFCVAAIVNPSKYSWLWKRRDE